MKHWKLGLQSLCAAMLFAAPFTSAPFAYAKDAPVYGEDAVISYASNGGIKNYQKGEPGTIFMQDRRLRWYKVTLSGDCLRNDNQATILFETDVNGTFDLFSKVSTSSVPYARCGVEKIVTSSPPKGQPGYRATE